MPDIVYVPLDFESLGDLVDGKVAAMFAVHLKRVAADCIDRPGEKEKRVVNLKFEFVPVMNQEGYADVSEAQVSCTSKLPTHRTTPIQLRLNPQGFIMNKHAPDSVHQHTADEIPGWDGDDEPDDDVDE